MYVDFGKQPATSICILLLTLTYGRVEVYILPSSVREFYIRGLLYIGGQGVAESVAFVVAWVWRSATVGVVLWRGVWRFGGVVRVGGVALDAERRGVATGFAAVSATGGSCGFWVCSWCVQCVRCAGSATLWHNW